MTIVRKESKNDAKLRWFDEARFGMFVHYGIYALLGRGEWVMYREGIPRDEYEKLVPQFSPYRFDADEWVDVAAAAGCRYITVTAKHHDGFCLFDSALTEFKITNTPFGRDLIGELVTACHRRRMRIILYYSQPDWHHPNFVHLPGAFKDLEVSRPDDQPDWPKYRAYVHGQVHELVTQYGQIDGIWFDGSHKSEEAWGGRELYNLIKKHQPHAVVNDRGRYGDFFTPERSLPEDLTGYLFEACESLTTQNWGWAPHSDLYNVPHLIDSLVRMAGAGGNYLLNVSPKPDGTLPEPQVERMIAIGQWLHSNGEAIYATDAAKLAGLDDDLRATRQGHSVYILMRHWPATNRLVLPAIHSEPQSVEWLGNGSRLASHIEDDRLHITGLHLTAPDAHAQVLHLRFCEAPQIDLEAPPSPETKVVRVSSHEPTLLPAPAAAFQGLGVKGAHLRLREGFITGWQAPEQSAVWTVILDDPAMLLVRVQLRVAKLYAGSSFVLKAGAAELTGIIEGHDPETEPYWQTLGSVRLSAGEHRLILEPIHMPYGYIFADVACLQLVPQRPS